jgi:3alpha(or 20beta)-hydroxysteroid dehydrogenase
MSDGRLSGRTAVVTGGAGGIGAAVVRRFVAEGARVLITDLADDAGKLLSDELEGAAAYCHLDVRSETEWAEAVAAAEAAFGPVSVLIGCAGIMVVAPVELATVEQFRSAFDVNVLGAFLGTRAVLPSMQRAGGGSIVIFSSAAGLEGSPGLSAYAASKAANVSFTRTAAMELGVHNIRVNAVAPGGVDTPMSNQPEFEGFDRDSWYAKQPVPRIGVPDDIVPIVLMLAEEEARFVTGTVVPIDGGMLAGHSAL